MCSLFTGFPQLRSSSFVCCPRLGLPYRQHFLTHTGGPLTSCQSKSIGIRKPALHHPDPPRPLARKTSQSTVYWTPRPISATDPPPLHQSVGTVLKIVDDTTRASGGVKTCHRTDDLRSRTDSISCRGFGAIKYKNQCPFSANSSVHNCSEARFATLE